MQHFKQLVFLKKKCLKTMGSKKILAGLAVDDITDVITRMDTLSTVAGNPKMPFREGVHTLAVFWPCHFLLLDYLGFRPG